MQYESQLVAFDTIDDTTIVSGLVGCFEQTCENVEAGDHPAVHFTLETVDEGMMRVVKLAPKIRPSLLNVLDYNLDEGYYLWGKVVKEGLQDPTPIRLDSYVSYNADNFKPHTHFDHWMRLFELIPPESIVQCSNIFSGIYDGGLSGINATQTYSQLTNDSNFSCGMNDSIWFSPACRHNTTECVPLLVAYNIDYAMQRAHFLNMPLAVMLVDFEVEYNLEAFLKAVLRGNFLFTYFQPNDALFDAEGNPPVLLKLPRHNDYEYANGIFVTGRDGRKAHNYGWRGLKAAGPYVHFFLSGYNLADHDVAGFIREFRALKLAGRDPDGAAWEVACGWVRANAATWQAWIPAICPPGQVSDASLMECLPCPTGSSCPGGTTGPSPCPPGRIAPDGGGAVGPEGCSECLVGGVMVGGACVSSVALAFAIAGAMLCLIGGAEAARRGCLSEEEATIRRGVEEIRRRLEIRRRDGYVLDGEWVPVWMWWRREALVFLKRAHVKAAVHLALLRLPPTPVDHLPPSLR
jgi:hypothetical protein